MDQVMVATTLPITLCHGPNKIPVRTGHRLAEVNTAGPLPFHGINSRGLLKSSSALEPVGPTQWAYIAPLLEDVLNQLIPPADLPTNVKSRGSDKHILALITASQYQLDKILGAAAGMTPGLAEITPWFKAALEVRLLSYTQSAQVACRYIEKLANGLAGISWPAFYEQVSGISSNLGSIKQCELWSVKEGHTSSVWRVSLRLQGQKQPLVFGLNIARDQASSRELLVTTKILQALHERDPEGVAKVWAWGIVNAVSAGGPLSVSVAAMEWIENARELHLLRDPKDQWGRFVVVEHFASSKDVALGELQQIVGKKLTKPESDTVWAKILTHLVKLSVFDPDTQRVQMPATEINEGDWVAANGEVKLIAISEPEPPVPLGEWVLRLLLLHGREYHNHQSVPLYWGNVDRACHTFQKALPHLDQGGPTLSQCLDAAKQALDCDPEKFLSNKSGYISALVPKIKAALDKIVNNRG